MSDLTGGLSSVVGANKASKATQQGIKAASATEAAALAQQKEIYDQQRADAKPYMDLGSTGVESYNKFTSDPTSYMNSPAYEWQQGQIDKNMGRTLSSLGRRNSSYGMGALATAKGNLAAQEYDAAYNRMLDPIRIGQTALASTNQAGANMQTNYGNYGNNIAGLNMASGQDKAQLEMGISQWNTRFNNNSLNSLSSLAGSVSSLYGRGGGSSTKM